KLDLLLKNCSISDVFDWNACHQRSIAATVSLTCAASSALFGSAKSQRMGNTECGVRNSECGIITERTDCCHSAFRNPHSAITYRLVAASALARILARARLSAGPMLFSGTPVSRLIS